MSATSVTSPETLTETASHLLRADIVTGVLRAGSVLRIERLKERYAIGASPLREALTKLASQGFVTTEANRGFRVAPMSRHDLEDITLARQTVEEQGLRRAMQHGGDEWQVRITAALHRLKLATAKRRASSQETMSTVNDAHWQFHHAVLHGCDSPRLQQLQWMYYQQAERYRQVLLEGMHDLADFMTRHEALTLILLKQDVEAAVYALKEHIALTPTEIDWGAADR